MTILNSEQARVFQKRLTQIQPIPNPASSFMNLFANRLQMVSTEVSQVCPRYICPKVFHRIELRGIGGEVFSGQPLSLILKELLYHFTSMRSQSIPRQDQTLTLKVPPQSHQKAFHLRASNVSWEKAQEKLDSSASGCGHQSRNSRKPFPIAGLHQNGRFPFWGPSSVEKGAFRKSTLVQKHQKSLQLLGFFLIRGHLYRTQR
jgi:hypothetical protein